MFRLSHLLSLCLILAFASGCQLVPRRVLVMDFEVATGDHGLDHLSKAVPEYFVTVMANSPYIYILERQDIQHYLDEIDRENRGARNFTRWQQLGARLAADYIVVGSVSRLGGPEVGGYRYIVTCRLFSVEKGQIVPGSAFSQECSSDVMIVEAVRYLGYQMIEQVSNRSYRPSTRTAAPTREAPNLSVQPAAPGR